MLVNWFRWLRSWCAWGRRRVAGRYGFPRRDTLLQIQRLEDRSVPSFGGGVSVAAGDLDLDGYTDIATGAGPGGGPHLKVFSGRTGDELVSLYAFDPAFGGGVSVALADVTGDGHLDLVAGAGPGGGPHVKVFDGVTLVETLSVYAYDPSFSGGVCVAAADFDGDGRAEVITGAGLGGGPHVKVFDGRTGAVIHEFMAFDPEFRGGTSVAAGDVTGDGIPDIVTGAGPGGGPHVKVFDGRTGTEALSQFAYEPQFSGGVAVAVGDVDGDGVGEVLTGAMAGGGPRVRAFRANGEQCPWPMGSFFAFQQDFRGGVFLAAADLNGDGRDDVIAGAGPGGGPHVRAFRSDDTAELASFMAYSPDTRGGGFARRGDHPSSGNTPPTISPFTDLELLAGTTSSPVPFTVNDTETEASRLEVSVASDNPTLVPAAGLVLGGTGRDRTLTLTPAATQVGEARVVVAVRDESGAVASSTLRLTVTASPVLPTLTSTADFRAATAFLYTGPNPVQTGVADGTITPLRAAVLRGKVVGLDGQSISGVSVTVLGHPEFGRTTTNPDGSFDMAVNGGGLLTVQYAKAGYLTVQRQAEVDWRDYTLLPEVGLTPLDLAVTAIDLSSPAPVQVARGSVETDADGTRQATLLFPQGETATMTLPDGTTQPLSTLHVRATEYTVGTSGPQAMPGTLPATSGYTYAVELSVDEAEQAGATQVSFGTAVPFYVENFLHFPTGMAVPAGYYDRGRGLWVPSDNGRVIQVLTVTGGVADLDTDGDGDADTAAELAALGVTDAERTQLAGLYQPGGSLWRVPITHFTPWDLNWPYGPPPGATGPDFDPDELKDKKLDDQNQACGGSVVGIENQTLTESIPIAGTPFSLVYQSDRVPGRSAERTLTIPLTRETPPPNLKRVELTVEVAGRRFAQSFSPTPELSTTFTWDGLDAYDRTLQGSQNVKVDIGYVYDAVYQSPAELAGSFGALSGVPITGNRARNELTLSQTLRVTLAAEGVEGSIGLGGWALDVHHAYDPVGRVLHTGDGHDQGIDGAITVGISTVAGNGDGVFSGDGELATQASIEPFSLAFGADGSLYIADSVNARVRRVGPDGIISTVAGVGIQYSSPDGTPATQAALAFPDGLAVAVDGSIYIAESGHIRLVRPDGIIITVAGDGTSSYGGEGVPARSTGFGYMPALALGADGSLYIADSTNARIRRIGADGLVTTVAGSGLAGFGGDGGPATQAAINLPLGVALGPDGSLYFADYGNARVRRVGPDGIITTVAGNGVLGFSGDGGAAIEASLDPRSIAISSDGSLYIADGYNSRIRRVRPDGVISTFVGNGRPGYSGDSGPATQAALSTTVDVVVGPEGNLYVADLSNNRVRRVAVSLPSFHVGDILIPSEDGSELYRFDSTGRHLQTLDSLTGTPIFTFGYDGAGRLISVTDANANVTSIERDANGNPTVIVAPFGQRTRLRVNADGYLANVTNPANETTSLGYGSGGLLTGFTDPLGHKSVMQYDALGRLVYDQDGAGGTITLAREKIGTDDFQVTTTNAEGGTRQYRFENLPDGSVRRTSIDGRGFATVTLIGTDGTETTTLPDGTVTTTVYGPDPRYGMLAPVVTSQTIATPSGLTSTTTGSRKATFATPGDPTSALSSLTDTVVVNGETFTTVYLAATHTVMATSTEGRVIVTTLDSQGRPEKIESAGILPVEYGYDSRGRLLTITQGDRTVTYDYDGQGNLATITDPLGRVTGLAYDTAGRITRQTQPEGTVIDFRYDRAGNMIGLTPPGQPEHTFTYDGYDQLTSTTPPAVGGTDDTTRYVYNLAHQLVTESLPGGGDIAYTYCECGRLTSITAPWGNYTYTYSDTTGVLSSVASPGGFTLTSGYDGFLRTSETLTGPVSGSVNWTFDSNFRVVSESVNGANPVAFAYDGDGLLTRAGDLTLNRDAQNGRVIGTSLGTVADTIGYDTFGDESEYSATVGGNAAYGYTFTRDQLGLITRKVETVGGVATTFDYGYDAKGQLTSVSENGVLVQSYAYDANGNRLSLTTPSGTTTGTYDAQDRLLAYGTKSYTYSPDGSLKSVTDSATGERTDYTYDGFGNLTRVALPDGRVIEYLIDGQNRRVGKKVNGVLVQGFLYDGQLTPVAELDGSGNVVARFVYATGVNVPAYMIKDGVTYRLVTDHLGSVRFVVNVSTGEAVQRLDYDAFGRVTLDTNPGFQPFGYAGGLYEQDTGLVRFGPRNYDSASGRWTANDPIGFAAGNNLYKYVRNSPVQFFDPYGTDTSDPATVVAPRPVPTPADGGGYSPLEPPLPVPPSRRPYPPGTPQPPVFIPGLGRIPGCEYFCNIASGFVPGKAVVKICVGSGSFVGCPLLCQRDYPVIVIE